jgi:succinate dehydrogenase flavin-adding protein (antitoxin of CptAB toxin-antitoxin module)
MARLELHYRGRRGILEIDTGSGVMRLNAHKLSVDDWKFVVNALASEFERLHKQLKEQEEQPKLVQK